MSTRAIIARTNQDSFVGVYHHNDGYPTGVGEALYKLYHGHFQDDLSKMLTTLIDKHPGGWSSIVGKDFSKRPGWHGPYGYDYKHGDTHPVCKCHGSRHEKDGKRTSNESTDCEWAYAIAEETHKMHIFTHAGYEGNDYLNGKDIWRLVAIVDLDDNEPNWALIEQAGE